MKASISPQPIVVLFGTALLGWCLAGPAAAVGPGGKGSFPVEVINADNAPVPVEVLNAGDMPLPVEVFNADDAPVPTADIYAPGRMPVRIGPVSHNYLPQNSIPLSGFEIIDAVEPGKTLILTSLHVIASSNLSTDPFTEAECLALLKVPQMSGTNLYTPFLRVPIQLTGGGSAFGSMPLFLALNEGEGLNMICLGEPRVSQGFRVTLGGYTVSAAQ